MIIYLYVKQHTITGLKYFGKTTRNPFKYSGSGKYWCRHFLKYGKDQIKTLEIWGFDDQELCTEFALKFSKENNIVKSKEWANLIAENGLDGTPPGIEFSKQHRVNISLSATGLVACYDTKNGINKRVSSLEFYEDDTLVGIATGKTFIREKGIARPNFTGKQHKTESKLRISESLRKSHANQSSRTCPHCNNTGKGPNMTRYHFNNCKSLHRSFSLRFSE